MKTKYATDIRIVRKGDNPDRPTFRHASTRHLSDKEIDAIKKEGMIGLDPSMFEIKEY